MNKNVMDRDMKSAFRPQHQFVAFVGQGNVPFSMSNTEGNTCRVLGIIEDPHPFAARNEKIIHQRTSQQNQ